MTLAGLDRKTHLLECDHRGEPLGNILIAKNGN